MTNETQTVSKEDFVKNFDPMNNAILAGIKIEIKRHNAPEWLYGIAIQVFLGHLRKNEHRIDCDDYSFFDFVEDFRYNLEDTSDTLFEIETVSDFLQKKAAGEEPYMTNKGAMEKLISQLLEEFNESLDAYSELADIFNYLRFRKDYEKPRDKKDINPEYLRGKQTSDKQKAFIRALGFTGEIPEDMAEASILINSLK